MILLDTHVWWWAISEPINLSRNASERIRTAEPDEIFIASISLWEFAMMVTRRRISLQIRPEEWLKHAIHNAGTGIFPLTESIALESCSLPGIFHKDPADRIIVATARNHKITLITKDQKIIDYPYVETVW